MTCHRQGSDWPAFRYELELIADQLLAFADPAGCVGRLLESLPADLGTEAVPT